jgi:hypothetical protein
VDQALLADYARNLRRAVESVPQIEWIFQLNDETKGIWDLVSADGDVPENMSVLFDASCGKGILTTSMCGYAGGLAPETLAQVLDMIIETCKGKPVWVDMESSLRVAISDKFVMDKDVFSIDKAFACIQIGVRYGLPASRFSVMQI